MARSRNKMYGDIIGLVCVILGIGLIVYAVSFFIQPFFAFIAGIFLINYGLMLKGLPPLKEILRIWLSRFKL